MTRGGNLTLIVVLLILWFVGIFLAGYYGYEHFDKNKKTETNLILFVLGVILAIGTFIGIIVLFIKRSRLPKTRKAPASTDMNSENAPLNLPSGRAPMPGYNPASGFMAMSGYNPASGFMAMPGYGPGMGPAPAYPAYPDNYMPVAPMGGYPMNQQYTI
jgi:hypothetical protein